MKKDYIFNLSQQVITSVVGFLIALYLSNTLSSDNYGGYVYIVSIITLLTLFSTLGLNTYGSKVYLSHYDEHPFSNIYSIQLAATFFVILITFFIIIVNGINIFLGVIICLNVLFISLQPLWYNIANNNIVVNSKILILSQIINLILVLLCVKNDSDIMVLFVILILINFIRFALVGLSIDISYKPSKNHFSFAIYKQYIIMFLPFLCISIYTILDKIMIANLADFTEVAIYNNGMLILKTSLIIISSMMPMLMVKNTIEIDDLDKNINKILVLIIYVSLILMFAFILTGKEIVDLLFNEQYSAMSYILVYGSIIVPITACSSMLSGVYFIPKGRNDLFLKSVLCGAISNIILNFLLIPEYGAFGGVIATIISEVIIIIIMLFYIWNILEKIHLLKVIIISLMINIIAFIIIQNIGISIILLDIIIKVTVLLIINGLVMYIRIKIKNELN